MAFPTSCLCFLAKQPSAYDVLPRVVGSRNGDRAATDLLKYGPGVAISIEKGTKRYYEMKKACAIYITTADMFIKIPASITFASEIGHQSKFMARRVFG